MNKIRFVLIGALLILTACSQEPDVATVPVNLSLLIDSAQINGDVLSTLSGEAADPAWDVVFREDFSAETWRRWTPSPNQVPPPASQIELKKRWQDAFVRLQDAAHLVSLEDASDNNQVLKIEGAFDLHWVGYVIPVKVHGGRQYRVSSRIKVEGAESEGPARVGFMGFLELGTNLPLQKVYQAKDVAPYVIADQKSPGATDVDREWREESFTLTLNENTETLLLYVCAYHGSDVGRVSVLFDDLVVEQKSMQPLSAYLQNEYITPWTSRVNKNKSLYKVAGWGNPAELSHHREGLLSPGNSSYSFPLDGKKYSQLAFSYGPLREYASQAKGQLVFEAFVNGEAVFRDTFDLSRKEGKEGWRRASIPVEQVRRVELKTSVLGNSQDIVGFWGAPVISPQPNPARRNALIICIDSLRKDFTGLYGGVDTVSVFTSLAKDGVTYDNYVSAGNTTRYALTSLMTGQYAGRNGLFLNTVYDQLSLDFRQQFAEQVPTFPAVFRDHNYMTFASMDNPFFLPVTTGLHMGFANIYNQGSDSEAYRRITDRAIAFFDENLGQSAVAFVHYDPHYLARLGQKGDVKLDEESLRLGYVREMEAINHQVKRLLARLQQSGQYETTDIVLVSDHGEGFDPLLPGHGYYLTPDQIIVPLVIKPAKQSKMLVGKRQASPVSTLDIAAWLASEHGLNLPQKFTGEPAAIRSEYSSERTLFSEGINQHRLLVMKPKGTYLLHKSGQEDFFGKAMLNAEKQVYRQEGIDFLMTARSGLYLLIAGGREQENVDIHTDGVAAMQIIGQINNDIVDTVNINASFTMASDGLGRVIFVPEEAIAFPSLIEIKRQKKDALIGLSPEFLPTEKGRLVLESREDLYKLTRPSSPEFAGQNDVVLAWYSEGAGARSVAEEQKELDPAMRSMMQRWGYMK